MKEMNQMNDVGKPSGFDEVCMEDFASIWIEDPDGDWVYDPHHRIS
jgi:hypothetical protein